MNWVKSRFELPHTTNKPIIPMEGIRGLAVFFVFLVHYVALVEPWLVIRSPTHTIAIYMGTVGHIGVDLFFVLSGYLIYGMLIQKQKRLDRYLFRRIQRIYPTFTAVFLLYLLLSLVFPSESKIPSDWLAGGLYIIQNYLLLPGLFDIKPIITVAWSLSYELFFYLVTPLLILLLKMRLWSARNRIRFIVLTSVSLFVTFAVIGGPIRLLMFVAGMLLFEMCQNPPVWIPPIGLPALLLAITAVTILTALHAPAACQYAALYLFFFLFCGECFLSPGLTAHLFSRSPLRWLGNMSYSYYLIHGLALKFIFALIQQIYPAQNGNLWLFWLLLPVTFALTLIPAATLFLWVEKPYSLTRFSPS